MNYIYLLHSGKTKSRSKKAKSTTSEIDVFSKLANKKNVQLVRLPVLQNYIEFNRRNPKEFKYEKSENYLRQLEKDIKANGLKEPLILAVSKETQRAYLAEGNHRIVCLENLGVHWVPLQVGYWFLNDEKNAKYPFIPGVLNSFPEDITPVMCGFEVRNI